MNILSIYVILFILCILTVLNIQIEYLSEMCIRDRFLLFSAGRYARVNC